MKKIEIKRIKDINDGTLGELIVRENGVILFECKTLEPSGADEIRPNQDRRIPKGKYSVEMYQSPKFKTTLPLIYNEIVPKDRYILIHWGNFPDDTEGCILVGDSFLKNGVANSKATFKKLMRVLDSDNLELFIE